jgi:hypothetical protein
MKGQRRAGAREEDPFSGSDRRDRNKRRIGNAGWFGSEELLARLNVGWATGPRYDWPINRILLNLARNYLLENVLNKPGTVV